MDGQSTHQTHRPFAATVVFFLATLPLVAASVQADDGVPELRFRGDAQPAAKPAVEKASFLAPAGEPEPTLGEPIDAGTPFNPVPSELPLPNSNNEQPTPRIATIKTLDTPANTTTPNATPKSIIEFLQNFETESYRIDDLVAVAGKPVVEKTTLDGVSHVFQREPFSQLVAFTASGNIVRIKGQLAKPTPYNEFRKTWSLTDFSGAIVPNSKAEAIGKAYPELGLVIYFKRNMKQPLVTHIDMRPLAAQPYLWRVQYGYLTGYADRFADLDRAVKVDPRNGDIHWVRAEILLELERPAEALREIETALQTNVATPRYRLTKGRALLARGMSDAAIAEFRAVAEGEGVSAVDRAGAETAWGTALALGDKPDYPASMQHHQRAIQYAGEAAREFGPMAARRIQRVLIDAHFGGAHAVALGPWSGGEAAARQWLIKANAFTRIFVEQSKGDPIVAIESQRRSIEILEKLTGENNVADRIAQAEKESELLAGSIKDEAAQQRIEWEMAQIYFRSARMMRKQGKMERVTQYYTKAYELMRKQEDQREATPAFNYLLGNVHFFAGSLYAVNQDDHAKAMQVYRRALEYYSRTLGPTMAAESGLQGERYVSMGVTFWQSGEREQAVNLSMAGLQLMEQAARRNAMPRAELAVPYSNLAHMKSEMGDASEALKYQRIAAEVKQEKSR